MPSSSGAQSSSYVFSGVEEHNCDALYVILHGFHGCLHSSNFFRERSSDAGSAQISACSSLSEQATVQISRAGEV